ncbi:MAG: LamG-like jellyroll fold domain-containing protein [Roseibacillus sp.]
MLSSLIVAACGPLSGQALLIDFNSNQNAGGSSVGFDPQDAPSAHLETGYQGYHADHEVAAEFSLGTYSAFGGVNNITILPSWPDTTDPRVMQSIDRGGGNDANWGGTKLDLITDWIGADSRPGQGGNGVYDGVTGMPTRLILTISGLPFGNYSWRSYHHDTEHMNGEFIMEVSTDEGATFVQVGGVHRVTDSTPGGSPASPMTYNGTTDPASGDPADLPSTIETSFTATGVDDVLIRFTPHSTAQVHQAFLVVNGFELELQTVLDLSVAPSTFSTTASQGTAVGTLTTTSGDPGDTFTYTLVAGNGGTDNGKFQITGEQLEIGTHDFTSASHGEGFSIRVRSVGAPSTDQFEAILTVAALVPDDADADDLLDEWERLWGGGSLGILSGLAGANADGDSLTDLEEFNLRDQFPNLDPTKADSDGDTLDDGDELSGAGTRPATDPTNPDTDGDGLDDAAETNTGIFVSATDTGTDPTNTDSDGDSYSDALELDANSNPTDPNSTPSLSALLCAYWPLDEVQGSPGTLTTPDQANGQDLDLVNLDGTNLIAGRFDKAFSFSNAAQTMLTRVSGAGDLLPIIKNPAYTVSLWINATGTGQNDLRFFSEASTTTNNPLFNIGTHSGGSNGAVDIYIRNSANANGGHDRSLAEPFDGNGWRHVAVVVDTIAQTVIVYIDGVADLGVVTYIDVYAPTMNTTSIGGILRAGPSHWVTGGIDEVSLWKTALSAEDVERLAGGVTVAELLNPTRLDVNFTRNGNDLVIDWASQAGMRYNLRSETDPSSADPVEWPIYDGNGEIMATPDRNTLTLPFPADAERFFVVQEFPAPPVTLFEENFDGADPGWTTGFDAADTAMNTAWALGAPSGAATGPGAANSGTNCYGTNLTADYGLSSNTWLRTPPGEIDLTGATGATVVFQQWVDMDPFVDPNTGFGDHGVLRVLEASGLPGTVTELGVVQAEISGFNLNGWVEFTAELPAAALGKSIVLEFIFVSDMDAFVASGWYIDDVVVTIPGS